MEARWFSGSATYFAIPRSALMNPDMMTPESTSISEDRLRNSPGIRVVRNTVSSPIPNADS